MYTALRGFAQLTRPGEPFANSKNGIKKRPYVCWPRIGYRLKMQELKIQNMTRKREPGSLETVEATAVAIDTPAAQCLVSASRTVILLRLSPADQPYLRSLRPRDQLTRGYACRGTKLSDVAVSSVSFRSM